MAFPFPSISGSCPICLSGCGAIYRGYYRRMVLCPAVPFFGFVAVRTGFCKLRRTRFALFPEFLVPLRSFSRVAFISLWQAWCESPQDIGTKFDRWFDALKDEVFLSFSTLYTQLQFILRQLRGDQGLFGVPPFSLTNLQALGQLPEPSIKQAVNHRAFGCIANNRIDPPP